MTKTIKIGRASDENIKDPGIFFVCNRHPGWGSCYSAKLSKGEKSLKVDHSFCEEVQSNTSRAGNGDIFFQAKGDGVYECSGVVRSYESGKEWVKIKGEEIFYLTFDEALCELFEITSEKLLEIRLEIEADLQRRRTEENEKAAEESEKLNLPELTGSEKQIAWANTIRLKSISKLKAELERITKQPNSNSETVESLTETILFVSSWQKASLFIDARFWSVRDFQNDFNYRKNSLVA